VLKKRNKGNSQKKEFKMPSRYPCDVNEREKSLHKEKRFSAIKNVERQKAFFGAKKFREKSGKLHDGNFQSFSCHMEAPIFSGQEC
jgi:hypothetical protein